MTLFPHPLRLEDAGLRGDVRLWKLLGPYSYRSSLGLVTAEEGFITDLASIPRALQSFFSPSGPWMGPAVIHDLLYTPTNTRFTRKQADEIFKEAMFNLGLDWPRREAIYRAVRLAGWPNYHGLRP